MIKQLTASVIASFLCIISFGQEKFAKYTSEYFDKSYDISVSQDKKDTSKFSYYIYCASADKLDKKVALMFDSKDYTDFIEFLSGIQATYKKWQQTAKENNVKELDKEIDAKAFRCEAAFMYGDWHFDFSVKLTARAKIIDDKMILIIRSDKLQSSSNQFIDHDGFYLVFTSSDEMDTFKSKIDLEKVKEHFRAKKNKDDLFN